MLTKLPRHLLALRFAHAAQETLKSLVPEKYMEAPPQATQRKITLESFDLVSARRPDVQLFNELIVQYIHGREKKIGQVLPDNVVVVHAGPLRAEGGLDVPMLKVQPTLVIDYVCEGSRRKDYEGNFRRCERELKVPYYLLSCPDKKGLSLFRRGSRNYVSVKPNAAGRLPIPELELEVSLQNGWARYWFRGELLPLPVEMQQSLEEVREKLRLAERREKRLLARLRKLGVDPDR